MPINTINFALASALLFMPPHYSVEQYQTQQVASLKAVELELATEDDFKLIADRILAANGTIEMFYRLAYADVRFFDAFLEGELEMRFAQTQQLLNEAQAYRNQLDELDENLALFCKNFQKLHRLYESYEYKKEADRVLLSRVDGPIAATFDNHSTDEELRAFIFGV